MNTKIMSVFTIVAILGMMGSLAIAPSFGAPANTATSVVVIPFSDTMFVQCANNGVGEDVTVEGTALARAHAVANDNGATASASISLQNVSGEGAITGDQYHGVGGARAFAHADGATVAWAISDIKLIGQGNGNNLIAQAIAHVTVNADGTTTANFSISNLTCK